MKQLTAQQYESVRRWMFRNARPLDIARWRALFEGGPACDILQALSCYQNDDGGFGHALEPDAWNPHSSPIQTWRAFALLREAGLTDPEHPLIAGIVHYFAAQPEFWTTGSATVPSMNDYPHAPWWDHDGGEPEGGVGFNPAAAVAGFLLRYADDSSPVRAQAAVCAEALCRRFLDAPLSDDMHEAYCLMELCGYLSEAKPIGGVPLGALRKKTAALLAHCIDKDTEAWASGYVCTPSHFIDSPDSPYAAAMGDYPALEADLMIDTLSSDGTWNVPWSWGEYPEAWAVSKRWWTAERAIVNLRYLKRFGRLPGARQSPSPHAHCMHFA